MSEPQVTGFDAVELLGYGSGGEVWLARERATGLPVALKRLRPGADLAARDRLRREAAVLAGIDHPHVVRLRALHGDGDDLVLVLDLAPGGSLTRLLAIRRQLDPGEVVTLAVPLAQALAAVHAQGIVHGDVTPSNVLFAADGRPLLSDLGVSQLIGAADDRTHGTRGFVDPAVAAGAAAGPASDVHGLAATAMAALTGSPPYDDSGLRRCEPAGPHGALLDALEPALAPDPGARPTAEALAVAIFDAAPASPVRLATSPGTGHAPLSAVPAAPAGPLAAPTHQVSPAPRLPDESPPPPAERPWSRLGAVARRRSRTAVVVAASGAALALAAAAGIAWSGAGGEGDPSGVTTRPDASGEERHRAGDSAVSAPAAASLPRPPGRWQAALATLDAARSEAFAAADPALLGSVYAANAPALRRDRAVLAELADAGLRAEGLRITATRVRLQARTPDQVRLAVTDVMPAYALVDADGDVVARRPGRGATSWLVVLARASGTWRVYDVLRA